MSELADTTILIAASWPPQAEDNNFKVMFEEATVYLCTSLVEMGAQVVYGGNLDLNGLTERLSSPFSSQRADMPVFVHVLDEPSLVRAGFDRVKQVLQKRTTGAIATWACVEDTFGYLSIDGGQISVAPVDSQPILFSRRTFPSSVSNADDAAALSFARSIKAEKVDACIAIGGKTGLLSNPQDHYFGFFPGVAEELIGVLEGRKPIVPLAAYGGCGRAIAEALGLEQSTSDNSPRQPGYLEAMDRLDKLSDYIPDKVRDDLAQVISAPLDSEIIAAIASIIKNWGEPKPANRSGYRTA
ncbi:hypothetical protein K9B32_10210 [Rhizobium sp. 3T7]|uniref:hypothetical protein n=1 Tax=Rhizobium sp. 3T7 TaxID=2874922 RepID=UPI001CCD43B9|nr:hypothetical protein [Rhizobium sp. 3T7]MBZ9790493.1 hypothetical protein [Rhizobium sp. 3T7]